MKDQEIEKLIEKLNNLHEQKLKVQNVYLA